MKLSLAQERIRHILSSRGHHDLRRVRITDQHGRNWGEMKPKLTDNVILTIERKGPTEWVTIDVVDIPGEQRKRFGRKPTRKEQKLRNLLYLAGFRDLQSVTITSEHGTWRQTYQSPAGTTGTMEVRDRSGRLLDEVPFEI